MLFVISCQRNGSGSDSQKVDFEIKWITNRGLVKCESVLLDRPNKLLYVSNSAEYNFKGLGFISKYSLDGDLIDSLWVSGLFRPTGMAIKNERLYVCDINRLVEIDVNKGTILNFYTIESTQTPGLNDIVITDNGEFYLTASNHHAIYKFENNQLINWIVDSTRLLWANGIISKGNKLIVAGEGLASIDIYSKEIEIIPTDSINDFDGIQPAYDNGYYLSSAGGSNCIWHLSKGGKSEVILSSDMYIADFFFDEEMGLYAPQGNISEQDYQLVLYSLTTH